MGCWSDAGIVDWGRTSLGKTTKVLKSGKRYISLSATRAKPSNAEPSNHFPCLRQSGNCSTGIVTHFAIPTTSVNSRLTKRTPAASMVARTRARSLESCCSAIYLIPPHFQWNHHTLPIQQVRHIITDCLEIRYGIYPAAHRHCLLFTLP